MKKQSFLQGALVLMLAGLTNRILGFVLRIILVRIIGDEGLGLFQMVFPFFITLLLLSTAGFPVAIAKLIPEHLAKNDHKGIYHLLKVSTLTVSFLGLIIATALFFSANFIAHNIFNDQRTYLIIIAIAPALIISPLAACLRGFFQGLHTMLPTAISQITEQIGRIVATLVLLNMLSFLGLKYQTASIAIGISLGEFTGLLILFLLFIKYYFSNRKKHKLNFKKDKKTKFITDFKKIAHLGIPITLGKIINSLILSFEAVLIPRQLQLGGLSLQNATALYGQLSGMVIQIIFLPTVITIALTTSLIPNMSAAFAQNNLKKIKNNYQDVIRITSYLGLPITVIFFTKGEEICQLLFAYPQAGSLLAIMAFSSTFIYYLQVSSGMLNAMGKPQIAVTNLAIGSIIKITGIYFLTPNPLLGIQGATISITLGYIVAAILNYLAIGHNITYCLNLKQNLLKPLFASFIIFYFNPYLENILQILNLSRNLHNIIVIFLNIIIYLLIMILLKSITVNDLYRLQNKSK